MSTYYSEWELSAAAWIESLIDRKVVSAGPVDTRDLEDVLPSDLKGFTRVHLCAGIATWDYALTLAGWPREREVWSVSAPCQPFSAAGKGGGTSDSRHLWPAVDWLIGQRRPHAIFGEQVASKDGRAWFDHVQADLEARGYAVGAAVTPASGYGAPHERHRNYFVATLVNSELPESERQRQYGRPGIFEQETAGFAGRCLVDRLEQSRPDARMLCRESSAIDLAHNPLIRRGEERADVGGRAISDSAQRFAAGSVASSNLLLPVADRNGGEPGDSDIQRSREYGQQPENTGSGIINYMPGPTNGFWRDADWLGCRDDRWRPVEPGTFPLAHGAPARVGRLRGYGNGIVLWQAVAFIQSFLEGEADFYRLRGL